VDDEPAGFAYAAPPPMAAAAAAPGAPKGM
jgi:hypothetical protein